MTAVLAFATPRSIDAAAEVHRDLLDAFMDRVRARLATADDAFVRDSLVELLASLGEQRDGYRIPVAESVAA
ncbi:hypothetical protein [Azospirillum sp. ST 5-10]|uniref:hypothetical protein n=1 Tax=unclassified Azospirillum TaxID=2630922 RepID=UPI003F4A03F6